MTPNILTEEQITSELASLPGWEYKDDKIFKEFQFKDFLDGLAFINKLSSYFEEVDHHPDLHIFYNKILFELQRFDIGGKVTDRDIQVAHKIEDEFEKK